jgi:glycosyltransferase involved in cell wall biosynthesis
MNPSARKTCWIIGRRNGVGLEQDAALVARALTEAGWQVACHGPRDFGKLLNPFHRADVVIHLERVFLLWTLKNATHFLIPNQERFPTRHLGRLKRMDHVLCKSRHAEEVFSKHHPSVKYIGFTSEDRSAAGEPDYLRFFHLAGRSTLKNTGLLLDLWSRHPEWPRLTIVQHPDNAPAAVPGNVDLVSRYLPDGELRKLQNACGIHLCPSLSEGWGHYIVEAMSCRAVTVVTDAPPMNELVDSSRGIVVPFHRSEPRHLGQNFHADPARLEEAITRLISEPAESKQRLGNAARSWFEKNQSEFTMRVAGILSDLGNQT